MAKVIDFDKSLEGIELFMRKCDQPTYRLRQKPSREDQILRLRLIVEELRETLEALIARDKDKSVDGLCDVVYVAGGGVLLYGSEVNLHPAESYDPEAGTSYGFERSFQDHYFEVLSAATQAHMLVSIEGWQTDDENNALVYEISMRALHLILDHAELCNIPLQSFFDEVQSSNMTKLPVKSTDEDGNVTEYGDAIKDKGGKVLKPETFVPVDFLPIFDKFGI